MLHGEVLEFAASHYGELTEALLELARLQAIELGEPDEALRTIDAAVEITPESAREALQQRLWMEGVACFYAGAWERGSRHFEAEMAVNGADVEVPVWRWLCDAHNPKLGVEQARARLLECGHDVRVPFAQVWRLFKGSGGSLEENVAEVLDAAERDGSADARMWGHFYVALHLEALGRGAEARAHFVAAADAGSCNNIAKLARAHLLGLLRLDARETWVRLAPHVERRRAALL